MKISKKSVFLLGTILLGITMVSGVIIEPSAHLKKEMEPFFNIEQASSNLMTSYANFFITPEIMPELTMEYKAWVNDLHRLVDYIYLNAKDNRNLKDAANIIKRVGLDLAGQVIWKNRCSALLADVQQLKKAKSKLKGFRSWFWEEQEKEMKKLLLAVIDMLEKGLQRMIG